MARVLVLSLALCFCRTSFCASARGAWSLLAGGCCWQRLRPRRRRIGGGRRTRATAAAAAAAPAAPSQGASRLLHRDRIFFAARASRRSPSRLRPTREGLQKGRTHEEKRTLSARSSGGGSGDALSNGGRKQRRGEAAAEVDAPGGWARCVLGRVCCVAGGHGGVLGSARTLGRPARFLAAWLLRDVRERRGQGRGRPRTRGG